MIGGIWILYIVLKIQPQQVILVPYMIFDDYQICSYYKDKEAKKENLTMTCLRENKGNV